MDEALFTDLKLIEPLVRSLQAENYLSPTAIQAQAIPQLLDGADVLGCAQTGTGKTAAFALPMLQRLHLAKLKPPKRSARSLILTPTRELAVQIAESFSRYGRYLSLRTAVVYGGVGQAPQVRSLGHGVDVLIATPGRLLDLIKQEHVRLDSVEILVLDEADRMLDMGFIRDVQKIIGMIPKDRQTLLFSATMPKEVAHLADSILSNPKKVQVAPVSSTAELIDDQVLFVERSNKRSLLLEVLQKDDVERALVFTRTKHRANRLSRQLNGKSITSEAIHGNKSQNARQRALKEFSAGRTKILVATDIVARGIDVAGISHVINYELPNEPASYVHRIGRTARAGTSGVALSFCDRDESEYLADIEKLLKRKVAVFSEHSHHSVEIAELHEEAEARKNRGQRAGTRKSPAPRSRGRRNSRRRPPSRRRNSHARAAVN